MRVFHLLLSLLLSAGLLLLPVDVHGASSVSINGSTYRNLQFDHLTTDEGLSQDMINDIVQDGRGYVWIATQEGLNRYDGYELVHYENLRNDPGSLSDDFVRTLLVDREGALLVGTKRGLDRYSEEIDGFEQLAFESTDGHSLVGDEVRALTQSHDGTLWIGTQRNGLMRVDASGQVQRFVHDPDAPESLPDNSVLALLEDSIGNLWIGTESAGLCRYDPVTNRFVSYHDADDSHLVVAGNEVRSIFEDRSGTLWIGTADAGLTRFDLKRGKIEHFVHEHGDLASLPDDRIRDVLEDSRGTLWVATGKGLAEWRGIEGFVTYARNPNDPRSLVNDEINRLYVDASGVLWVGTWDGVSRWNYFSDTFSYRRVEDGTLSGNVVTSVAEGSTGVLWVAAYGTGLNRVDPVTGELTTFRSDPADSTTLPSDEVTAVHVDAQDRVWIGTRQHGLALLEEDGGSFRGFRSDGSDGALSSNKITSVLTDAAGNLWVGTFGGGLNRTSASDPGVFERFRFDDQDSASLSGDRVLKLYLDRSDVLWVAMDRAGVNRYDAERSAFERFERFEIATAESAGVPAAANAASERQTVRLDTAMDLLEDRDGSLWIGTLGQGLWRWNATQRRAGEATVSIFGKPEGLPTDTIYGVLEEGSGALWLSSNRGLTRFDLKGGVRQFDNRNGLRDREFIQGSRLRAASGKLMFGGISGLVSFFPGDLPVNTHSPTVVVDASSRRERLASSVSGEMPAQIEVDYLDRFLAFNFVALDFTSPDKNQYRYMLQGFDDGWIEGDNVRRASYTNLTPGRYRFLVEAANNDGLWGSMPASIDVRVVPAPWNTWWAYLVYALIGAALLGSYLRSYRLRSKAQAAQRVMLEEKVANRTRELAVRNEQLESLNDQLAKASVTDSLTGLKNRRYLDELVSSGAGWARKLGADDVAGERPQTLFFMMIDLDDFKLINDRFGHQAGDSVLLQIKDVLEASCRDSDVLIRWGGDEFMIIGIVSSAAAAKLLAERVRAAVADLVYDAGNGAVGLLSASVGVATFALGTGTSAAHWELIVAIADRAAYIAKSNGRNAWVCLDGAEDLEETELEAFKEGLEELVEAGRVRLDSSLRHPPSLDGVAEQRRLPPRALSPR